MPGGSMEFIRRSWSEDVSEGRSRSPSLSRGGTILLPNLGFKASEGGLSIYLPNSRQPEGSMKFIPP
ncbi:MAG: hypothetical protein PVJ01_07605, partial [Pseudomonadota bacterium]